MSEIVLSGICLCLIGLLVAQHIHWSRVNHRLIDKIMSRNYADYVKSENLAKPSPQRQPQNPDINVSDPVLDELNSSLGLI